MRDLAIFITAFYNVVSSMVVVHEAISTHRDDGRGQDDITLHILQHHV